MLGQCSVLVSLFQLFPSAAIIVRIPEYGVPKIHLNIFHRAASYFSPFAEISNYFGQRFPITAVEELRAFVLSSSIT